MTNQQDDLPKTIMAFTRDTFQKIHERIASKVSLQDTYSHCDQIKTIAGADTSCGRFDKTGYAAVLVFRYPEMELIEQAECIQLLEIPYVPGFLAFREGPLVLDCLNQLSAKPDVLLCDGQGLAHPGRAGIACHMGVQGELPSIGCAKTRLTGEHEEPGVEKGSRVPLYDNEEQVGVVLRSKRNVKPLYISPGHCVSIGMATNIVLSCCNRYRLPEPTRLAHLRVNEIRRAHSPRSND